MDGAFSGIRPADSFREILSSYFHKSCRRRELQQSGVRDGATTMLISRGWRPPNQHRRRPRAFSRRGFGASGLNLSARRSIAALTYFKSMAD
jgi:hypothetical protein